MKVKDLKELLKDQYDDMEVVTIDSEQGYQIGFKKIEVCADDLRSGKFPVKKVLVLS